VVPARDIVADETASPGEGARSMPISRVSQAVRLGRASRRDRTIKMDATEGLCKMFGMINRPLVRVGCDTSKLSDIGVTLGENDDALPVWLDAG